MYITWLGTNSLRLEAGKEQILVDPFIELAGGANPNSMEAFYGADTILVTHGHFDHLFFVQDIMEEEEATVFCTDAPAQTLENYSEQSDLIVKVAPGQEFQLGEVKIRVYQGRHIHFDTKLILKTLNPLRLLRHVKNLPFLGWASSAFKENKETVCYGISCEGKQILLMGSLGLDPEEHYPLAPDLLIMPYQGNSNLPARAREVLERIRPKAVLLTHFDDAFPPVSTQVDLRGLRDMMNKNFPDIKVVRPTAGKRMRF